MSEYKVTLLSQWLSSQVCKWVPANFILGTTQLFSLDLLIGHYPLRKGGTFSPVQTVQGFYFQLAAVIFLSVLVDDVKNVFALYF